jgi:hypothetical protein
MKKSNNNKAFFIKPQTFYKKLKTFVNMINNNECLENVYKKYMYEIDPDNNSISVFYKSINYFFNYEIVITVIPE